MRMIRTVRGCLGIVIEIFSIFVGCILIASAIYLFTDDRIPIGAVFFILAMEFLWLIFAKHDGRFKYPFIIRFSLAVIIPIAIFLVVIPYSFGLFSQPPALTRTPSPTHTPTPVETSVEVANVPFVIRDNAGAQIGTGTVQLFASEEVRYPETALITLNLTINSFYVTSTPLSTQNTAVPRITSTPRLTGSQTPVPTLPIWEDQGVEVFQIMGASLICSPSSFTGCSDQPARPIQYPRDTWTWHVAPQKDVFGEQNLRIELWIPQTVNGVSGSNRVVSGYDFIIHATVLSQPPLSLGELAASNFAAIVAALATIVAAIIGGYFLIANSRRENSRKKSSSKSSPSQQNVRPAVFISYRRSTGWATARSIHDSLEKRGVDLFMDVESINEGKFAEIIEQAITSRQNFVVVLSPDTLASEWVKKEIICALQSRRNIIPIMVDGFAFPDTLPPELSELPAYNAVRATPEYFDATIDKLFTFLK